MFAFELSLLTGRYVATQYNDRRRAEWPPHPARLFSALTATHFSDEHPDPLELQALEWLEAQGAPELVVSDASRRDVVTVFVPVNDPTVIGSFDDEQQRIDDAKKAVATARMTSERASHDRESQQVKRADKAVRSAQTELDSAEKRSDGAVAKAVAILGKFGKVEPEKAASLLPDGRERQPRTFPSVAPDHAVIVFRWPSATPGAHLAALDRLASKVVRVGHSSSLVSLRITQDSRDPVYVPVDVGEFKLRVVRAGQLKQLEAAFERHRETEPRVMPASFQDYDRPSVSESHSPSTLFSDHWIVLEQCEGPSLPASRAPDIAKAVRGALMSFASEGIPETLSGHAPDGTPADHSHLAIVSLPFVGHEHADGAVKGVALVLPRSADMQEKLAVYRALRSWEETSQRHANSGGAGEAPELRLLLGSLGVLCLRRLDGLPSLETLNQSRWSKSSRRWATVTPVALDRNPGNLRSRDAAELQIAIAEAKRLLSAACERIGLPRPTHTEVLPAAPFPGGLKAKHFSPFPRDREKFQRVLTHALLEFDVKVGGPVLLGAGRYQGLGLFRPLGEEGS